MIPSLAATVHRRASSGNEKPRCRQTRVSGNNDQSETSFHSEFFMPLANLLLRRARLLTLLLPLSLVPLTAKADDGLNYETEKLPNGLTVIYAPMPTSPVTQVQVFYHVGSKDERADRQGFAHMFE